MAIFSGLYGSSARFVRAQTIAEAKHILRASFGFAPRGHVRLVAENHALSLGLGLVYDRAVETIDGLSDLSPARQKIARRANGRNEGRQVDPAKVNFG